LGFKTITITEEAYKMLTSEKKGDESFSEVIKRLTRTVQKPVRAKFLPA